MKKVKLINPMNRGGVIVPSGSFVCLDDEEAEKFIKAGSAKEVDAVSKEEKVQNKKVKSGIKSKTDSAVDTKESDNASTESETESRSEEATESDEK